MPFCYAELLSLRQGWSKLPWTKANITQNLVYHPDRLKQPLKWKDARFIFVNSMSDLFHEDLETNFIDEVFAVMARCPQHIFQVLTKRPEVMREYMNASNVLRRIKAKAGTLEDIVWPLPNCWMGTSVETQGWADKRIPILLDTPAAIRWISAEPLLGPITLDSSWTGPTMQPWIDKINPRLNWVVVGGESGNGFRPMDMDWARSLRDQCINSCTAFYFKQKSGIRSGMESEIDGIVYHNYPERYNELV